MYILLVDITGVIQYPESVIVQSISYKITRYLIKYFIDVFSLRFFICVIRYYDFGINSRMACHTIITQVNTNN